MFYIKVDERRLLGIMNSDCVEGSKVVNDVYISIFLCYCEPLMMVEAIGWFINS